MSEPRVEIEQEERDKSSSNLIVYAAIICVVLFIIYKLYNKFVDVESDEEPDLDDFNVREAVSELQRIQQRVIGKLSSESNI